MNAPDVIANVPKWILQLGLVPSILLGLAECFIGYKILRVLIVIFGFFLGAIVGLHFGTMLFPSTLILAAIVGLVGAVLGGLLMLPLFYAGVFVIGGWFGFLVAAAVAGAAGWHIAPVFFILPAIVAGILAVLLRKLLLVLVTATGGAWIVVICTFALIRGPDVLSQLYDPWSLGRGPFIGWLVLAILGAIAQYSWGERDESEKEPAAED